jgi:hypothetical protein
LAVQSIQLTLLGGVRRRLWRRRLHGGRSGWFSRVVACGGS